VRIPQEAGPGVARATLSYPKRGDKVKLAVIEFNVPK
jgi:hypothetical protein